MGYRNLLKKGYIWIRSIPIFYRLLFSFLVVILIPALIVIGILYRNVEKEFYKTGLNYISQNLDNTVQKCYEIFRNYENELLDVIKEEELNLLLLQKDTDAIKRALQKNKEKLECDNMFVITPNSLIEHDKMAPLVTPQIFRQRTAYQESLQSDLSVNWFNTIHENDMYYTNYKKSSYMGNYLTVTGKIVQSGKVIGLLVVNLDIARMSALADIDKVFNQDQFLIDKDGLITYLNIDYVYREYPKWVWREVAKSNSEIISCKVQGKDMLFMTQKLGKSDWKVVTAIIKDNLLKASYQLRRQQILVVCITILISLVFCILVTLSISYPLKKIKAAMQQYARHDFALRLEDVGNDEISAVSGKFQDMSERIGELVDKEILSEREIAKERIKQRDMTLSALQMQINPHFLYNTLDLIRWNVMELEHGNDRVSKMIGNYSTMLRYNIRLEDGYTTIKQEIDYTEKYIKLLNMLYQTEIKLEVICNDDNIYTMKIGKLFFQPIIENAVIHGKLNKRENPIIIIKIKKEEDLCITIKNNGNQMTEEKINSLNEEFALSGTNAVRVGLYNINQRIKLLFGETYGLTAKQEGEMACFLMKLPSEEKK